MFFIGGASVLAWYLALRTWVLADSLLRRLRKTSLPLLQASSSRDRAASALQHPENLLGSVSGDYRFHYLTVASQTTRLSSAVWLIGTLASVLPLLGLLGTVLGMLISFEVIQIHGTSQPRLLASGIGQALMTTQAGLWTAVPVLFFHHVIRNRIRLIRNETEVLSHIVQTRLADRMAGGRMRAPSEPKPDSHRVGPMGGQ